MSHSTYTPPIKVSIPTPCEIPRARGPNAVTGYGGNLRIRCSDAEYDLIKEEARQLGFGIAAFGRWTMTHVARVLKEHREKQLTSDYAGEDDEPSSKD